jgi:hypothetical protein
VAKSLILAVKVQVGTDVREAFRDMIELSRRMQMMITTEVNGVHIYVWTNDTVERLIDRFHYATEKKLPLLPIQVPDDWRPKREW